MEINSKEFELKFKEGVNKYAHHGLGYRKDNKVDKLNRYKFIEAFNNNKAIIMKSPRQVGVSTMLTVLCNMLPNKKILYITHNLRAGACFLDNVDNFNGHKQENHSEFQRGNIKILIPKPDAFIGYTADLVIIESAAFLKDLKNIIQSVVPQLSISGSKLIITSTPDKPEGFFYEMFTKAEKGEIDYFPVSFKTWMDEKHIEKMKEHYNNVDSIIQRQIYGEFAPDEKTKMKTIPAVRVNIETYVKILEKINYIERMSMSDYIRGLIEKDLKNHIFRIE